MSPTRARTRGLTLLEISFTVAVLAGGLLAVLSVVGSSLKATRLAKPRFLAQQAARSVADELRADAGGMPAFYAKYWGDPAELPAGPFAVTPAPGPGAAGAVVRGNGTSGVFVDLDAVGTTFATIIDPALRARLIQRPGSGNGAVLRLRLLSEANYNALWAATPADLNFNGTTSDGIQRDGSGSTLGAEYRIYPLLVEVHWRDEDGDRLHRLCTTISTEPAIDPSRS